MKTEKMLVFKMFEVKFFEYTIFLHGYYEENLTTFGSTKADTNLQKLVMVAGPRE